MFSLQRLLIVFSGTAQPGIIDARRCRVFFVARAYSDINKKNKAANLRRRWGKRKTDCLILTVVNSNEPF